MLLAILRGPAWWESLFITGRGALRCGAIRWTASALSGLAAVALAAAPSPLKVVGNQLVDRAGQPARLRGVNCAGLEWAADGNGRIVRTVEVAVTEWHANLIRLPLSQDRWFGHGPEQKGDAAGYRALVRQLVDFCAAHNAYVLLDLHWSNAGEWGRNIGQHHLPDRNSVEFWKDVATTFQDHPAVLFDLYNEPAHINWDQWFRGGPITETDEKTGAKLTYEAVGLPALVAAIRAAGAKNVIVAGGINWAYELEGILPDRELVDRQGNGIVYGIHPYPHGYEGIGRETIAKVAARIEAFAAKRPVLVAEFGSIERMWPFPPEEKMNDEKWNREMLRVLEEHRWNWTAWDFHPTAWPCLISDWNYTPTPEFGVWVKQALAENLKP
jgi:endoglucanase